jgi:hypothetical protein
VSVTALELVLRLEAGGFELQLVGDRLRVHPVARLAADDVQRVKERRDELVLLVQYCEGAPVVGTDGRSRRAENA